MISRIKKMTAATLTLATLAFAPAAHAGLITFDIKWANDSNTTIGNGVLTLDSSYIQSRSVITIDHIQDLTVTISGATVGNGVFGKSYFSGIDFYTASPVNMNQELIGQMVTVNMGPFSYQAPYGVSDDMGATGAFDLFAVTSPGPAPHTVRPFHIITDSSGDFSDYLHVSSIMARGSASAVPEPESYLLMLGGLAVIVARVRRKQMNKEA